MTEAITFTEKNQKKSWCKIRLIQTAVILAAFLPFSGFAQFKVDAELRNRSEVRDGYAKLAADGATPAFQISQRTRISFGYETEKLKIKITPQDVRIWGDDTNFSLSGSNGNSASLDLFEGFADIKIGKENWLAVGRQQLSYDNQSILSNANWNQNGISSDAVQFKLKLQKWNLHLAGSWNTAQSLSANNYFSTDRYKSIDFAWLNRQFESGLKLSLVHVAAGRTESDTSNTIYFRQTTGLYSNYAKNNLTVWGDAYYQYGKSQAGKKVSAFLLDVEAGYKIKTASLGAGYSYISGNTETGSNLKTDKLYDPIYRSRHTFNGFMDYYSAYQKQTAGGGLSDLYLFAEINPSKKLSIRNNFHFFSLAEANPATPADKNLGTENDLCAKYKFSDWGLLEGGYFFYLPTESLKTIQGVKNGGFSQFLYLQLSITPSLFKASK